VYPEVFFSFSFSFSFFYDFGDIVDTLGIRVRNFWGLNNTCFCNFFPFKKKKKKKKKSVKKRKKKHVLIKHRRRTHGSAGGFAGATGRWETSTVSGVTANNGDGTGSLHVSPALAEAFPGTQDHSSAETHVALVPAYDTLVVKAALQPTPFGLVFVRAQEIAFRSGGVRVLLVH
jgi:hypothetical protein